MKECRCKRESTLQPLYTQYVVKVLIKLNGLLSVLYSTYSVVKKKEEIITLVSVFIVDISLIHDGFMWIITRHL